MSALTGFIGVVKKVGSGCFKIAHEKYRAKNAEDQTDQQLRLLDDVLKQFPDLKPTVQKSVVSVSAFHEFGLVKGKKKSTTLPFLSIKNL